MHRCSNGTLRFGGMHSLEKRCIRRRTNWFAFERCDCGGSGNNSSRSRLQRRLLPELLSIA